MPKPRTAVCTIVSNNYLALARTLMGSLARAQPEWDRFVLMADEIRGIFDPASEDFEVVEMAELRLPDPRRFAFRYTILELNTAVKPWWLQWLFQQRGYDRVIYLDPDIFAYEPLVEVERALDSGRLAVLTPHLTGQLDDHHKPNELDILRAGVYNLGFLALARHPELLRFLHWWQSKTEFDCVVDFAAHLFVDQRWVDLVPGMFPDVEILRHEGYNVGYWNLAHRPVKRENGRLSVNGQPLVFFHFSGIDPARPRSFSKHQDRFTLQSLGDAGQLVLDYCDQVLANGWEQTRDWPYAFDRFADGSEIAADVRSLYRKDPAVQQAGGDDPFALGPAYFNAPSGASGGPVVTRLMRHIWDSRADLRQHFPEIEGADRRDFVFWFAHKVATEQNLPDVYVQPARVSLGPQPDASPRERAGTALLRLAERFRPLARHLPLGLKLRLRRGLRRLVRSKPGPVERVRPQLALGFGVTHAGFFAMDAYDRSVESAWMGSKALVRLVGSAGKRLRIAGEHHADLHREAQGSSRLTLRIAIDDEPLATLDLERGGPFEEEIDLGVPVCAGSILSLEASASFVPAQIGLGADPRELALKISRIEVDGEPVLDFGRAGNPYVPEGVPSAGLRLGLNIVGYLQSELGVGESARLCAASAEAAAIPFVLVDFSLGCSSRAEDKRWTHHFSDENPHPINLVHVNADQVPVAHAHLGPAFFDNHYNIGFWHWELPEFPNEWLGSFGPFNEIWVPTRFVVDAIGAKAPVPVVRMPHAIEFEIPRGVPRARFGLPEARFLFLTMYDMHSIQQRKNPEGALEAFRRAFPDVDGVGLVVKVMNSASDPAAFESLRQRLGALPGAHLIDETLSRRDVYALESVCDCFVSLHRSEGFGLGLAESMYLGKPVIGTGWSSNTDFMDAENSCPVRYSLVTLDRDYGPYQAGQTWADPDLDHAAWHMRRLVEDADQRRRIALAGQRTIRSEYSAAAVGRRYRSRLDVIARLV